jgi:hypothetical protein
VRNGKEGREGGRTEGYKSRMEGRIGWKDER